MRCKNILLITSMFMPLWLVSAEVADISIHSIIGNASNFDHQADQRESFSKIDARSK